MGQCSLPDRIELRHVVLVTTFVSNSITWGMCYANSAFYYGHWINAFQAEKGLTALVGSLSIGIVLVAGPISSSLTNLLGFRVVTIMGGLISTAAMLGAAYSTSIYALIALYGCLAGLGWGLVATPATVAITHYFDEKYHGIILAISSSGVGFGQFLTPIIAEYLTQEYSWRGCLIIQAGLNLNLCVNGALLRPVPSMKSSEESGGIFQIGIFKNINFVIFLIHCVFLAIGVSVMFVHFAYGVETFTNTTTQYSSLAVSILGLGGLTGRFVHCIVVKLPKVNVIRYYLISLTIGGIVLVLFPLVRNFFGVAVCASLIGYFMAVYGATQIIIILCMVDLKYTLTGYGWCNLTSSFGMMAGAPLAGALYDWTENYAVSMYFGGGATLLSVVLMLKVAWYWKQNRYMKRDDQNEGSAEEEERTVGDNAKTDGGETVLNEGAPLPVDAITVE